MALALSPTLFRYARQLAAGGDDQIDHWTPSTRTMSTPAKTLDLRGVTCPINYVRAKIALEQVALGECVCVRVDAGEPAANVPRSAGVDGHEVSAQATREDGSVEITLKRGR